MAICNNPYENEGPARRYDAWAAQKWHDRDVQFWLSLAKEVGGPILELACGTGRVLLPMAREGHRVTGLDISPHMLAETERKLAQESELVQARVQLIQDDMTSFNLEREFNLIFIAFRSFQALMTRDAQRSCLQSCLKHLSSRGRLGINIFNPKLSIMLNPEGHDFNDGEHVIEDGTRISRTAHTTYDLIEQRLLATVRDECIAPEGTTMTEELPLHLRFFHRFELEWMLEACGFEVETIYGNFDRSPLQTDSPEMIVVAQKR